MTIRVIIVDDEELARRGVRVRLDREPDVEVVAECGGGTEAIAAIRSTPADLVFLDVDMPETDGFQVIAAVGPESFPHVVFITAHDRYAVRAFEVHALDYVLKPIDDERFAHALGRAREAITGRADRTLASSLRSIVDAARSRGPSGDYPQRLAVRSGSRVLLVAVNEIDWIEAAGDYVTLHVGKTEHLVRETMTSIESKLDPTRFARVHRSAIVRLDRIRELEAADNGEFHIRLATGRTLKLSRGYRRALERIAPGLG